MRIVFLRHATAVPSGTRGVADAERPLTDGGRQESVDVGRAFRVLGLQPAQVVTSPYVRARETARLAAREAGWEVVEDDVLAAGFSVDDLPGVLRRHPGQTVVLVGHEPDLSSAVAGLSGARVQLPKAGAAAVEVDHPEQLRDGRLHWLLRPAQLRRLAAAA
jgi:phosphohistidine phosphatase